MEERKGLELVKTEPPPKGSEFPVSDQRNPKYAEEYLTAGNEIGFYLHCGLCLEDIKTGASGPVTPAEYARLNIGYTHAGLQIWCVRHDVNVAHVDFEGQQHPANIERRAK